MMNIRVVSGPKGNNTRLSFVLEGMDACLYATREKVIYISSVVSHVLCASFTFWLVVVGWGGVRRHFFHPHLL
jgi:hypothetical protein